MFTNVVITGYEVTRFGVPMIGQYVNAGRGSRVTISPVVPGAQYRVTAWALSDSRRSAMPAKYPTTGVASECDTHTVGLCHCQIIKTIDLYSIIESPSVKRMMKWGILSWLRYTVSPIPVWIQKPCRRFDRVALVFFRVKIVRSGNVSFLCLGAAPSLITVFLPFAGMVVLP